MSTAKAGRTAALNAAKKKTVLIGDGLHEPYGFRKYPGGVFSRNLADFKNIPVEYFSARLWLALPTKPENLCSDETAKDSQAINGERKVCASADALKINLG